MDEGESAESSGEEFRRKRTAVKTMTMAPLPTPQGYKQWVADLVAVCCSSSNRFRRRTVRYIQSAEKADEAAMSVVPRRWEPFDTELSQAILRIATGSLRRELSSKQQTALDRGETLPGRLALCILHQRFRLESGQTAQVEMTKLMALRFNGDLELFLDSLDTVLASMSKEPDEAFLMALIEPEHRKAKSMSHEFVFYDHVAPGDRE
jgi:hypothetical protein